MSLVPDYEDSTDSDSSSRVDSLSETEEASLTKDVPMLPSVVQKLPTPNFGESKDNMKELKNSVFKNPFIEAENAKEAILQKHVKMVDTKDNVVVINGKKICWNYRKGRCRFGHNCKFAHDSDIQKTQDQIANEKVAAIQNSLVCQNTQLGHSQYISQTIPNDSEADSESLTLNKKRKRPGLTQGLIPGKKVMKQYLKHQKT